MQGVGQILAAVGMLPATGLAAVVVSQGEPITDAARDNL